MQQHSFIKILWIAII